MISYMFIFLNKTGYWVDEVSNYLIKFIKDGIENALIIIALVNTIFSSVIIVWGLGIILDTDSKTAIGLSLARLFYIYNEGMYLIYINLNILYRQSTIFSIFY